MSKQLNVVTRGSQEASETHGVTAGGHSPRVSTQEEGPLLCFCVFVLTSTHFTLTLHMTLGSGGAKVQCEKGLEF